MNLQNIKDYKKARELLKDKNLTIDKIKAFNKSQSYWIIEKDRKVVIIKNAEKYKNYNE